LKTPLDKTHSHSKYLGLTHPSGLRRNLAGFLWCAFVSVLSGCALYNKQYQNTTPLQENPDYTLSALELDEMGWLRDERQASAILASVQHNLTTRNTVVVVYVHGWHHNAKTGDGDIAKFDSALKALHAELTDTAFVRFRQYFGLKGSVGIVGVYVGWRGRSLPSVGDYATFWTRKEAANRVGNGDLRAFLLRLNSLYERRLDLCQPADSISMVLVTLGHSFGGQAVFRAVAPTIEQELVEGRALVSSSNSSWLGDPDPRPSNALSAPTATFVSGLGDLTVLVNPAVEAAAFEPMRRFMQSMEFSPYQTPQLIVFSAENDRARSFFFPAGRTFATLFRVYSSEEQYNMDIRSLGMYAPQVTHGISKERTTANYIGTGSRLLASSSSLAALGALPFLSRQLTIADSARLDSLKLHPETIDFSRRQAFNSTVLDTLPGNRRAQSNAPIMLVNASPQVIDGHSGFFNDTFSTFLIRLVTDITAKRIASGCPRLQFLQTLQAR
jgi:hypothetical protein